MKEKATHSSSRALPLSFTHLSLQGETNDTDLGPGLPGGVHSCGGRPLRAPATRRSPQLPENSGRRALGRRPLTRRPFLLLAARSQWAGSPHRLPWQREDGSAVPSTDVT